MDPKLKALIDKQGTEWVVTNLIERARGAERDKALAMLEQLAGTPLTSQKAAIDWWRVHKQRFSGRLPKPDRPDDEFERLVGAAAKAVESTPTSRQRAAPPPRPTPAPTPDAPRPRRDEAPPAGVLACTHCGLFSYGKNHTPGKFSTELALWLCFGIPGVIYSIWRIASKAVVCPGCGEKGLIPLNTPKGRELWAERPIGTTPHKEPPERPWFWIVLASALALVFVITAAIIVRTVYKTMPGSAGVSSPTRRTKTPDARMLLQRQSAPGGGGLVSSNDSFEIVEVTTARAHAANGELVKLTWTFTVRNKLDRADNYDAFIELRAADGHVVHTDQKVWIFLSAGAQNTFSGNISFTPEVAETVAGVVANVRRR